ncbi:hypothetical protein AAAC51_08035 [Priestia megaterium]
MAVLNRLKDLGKIGSPKVKELASSTKQAIKEAPAKTGKKIVKSTIKDVKPDKNGKTKKLQNLYTGKKLNPLHVSAVGLGYMGYQATKEGLQANTLTPIKLATMNDYQEIGAPDIMMYDGVSQERAPRNLNADGSLVFGLHNMRRG